MWLRPPDPLEMISGLSWEAGNERIIRACAPAVRVVQLTNLPWKASTDATHHDPAAQADLRPQLPELRLNSAIHLIAILRREWGLIEDNFTRLVRRAAEWARELPEQQFVMLSQLNARLERPFRSLQQKPGNLHHAPPLPYLVYAELLRGVRSVLTDSPLIAAEA